jgi:glycosyltransferase involved in cell wall biosynthesis
VNLECARFPVLRRIEFTRLRILRTLARLMLHSIRARRQLAGARVVYVNTVTCPSWLVAAWLSGCPAICHVHECEPDWSRLRSKLLLMQLFFATRVVANSSATREWIGHTWPSLLRRTQVIYNGIDDPLHGVVARGIADPDELLVIGRLAHRKGQDVAIKALSVVRQTVPGARLTIVGDCFPGSETYVRNLSELAETLFDDSEAVTFIGWDEDVGRWMERAGLVLIPSRVEPFGLVAVEAMIRGKVVIASKIGGLREIISHGSTGWLVERNDPSALAEACITLRLNCDLRNQMGRRARESAVSHFGADRYRAEIADLCHEMMKRY